MLTKYATLEQAQILDLKGSSHRVRNASLAKLGDFEDYRTQDGFLYARIRAISSRVNKNYDGWPSVELAGSSDIFDKHTAAEGGFTVEANADAEYGYSTFLGKPIFVDHHNSNPERARGVIVDAKFHVDDHKTASLDPYYASDDCDPLHKPASWVELLLEVDAKSFPKLAKAIIEGSKDPKKGIDGFSMGCDVERSVCNICSKEASSPDEYCNHVKMKGAEFKHPKTGKVVKSYENCYGIKFFEISAVFDPADETALTREVVHESKVSTMPGDGLYTEMDAPIVCPECKGEMVPDCPTCHGDRYIHAPVSGHDGYLTPQNVPGLPLSDEFTDRPNLGPIHQGSVRRGSVMMHKAMTARDYRLLAQLISTAPVSEREQLAQHFAQELMNTNPRFDQERFLQAAIGQPGGRDVRTERDYPSDTAPGNTAFPEEWADPQLEAQASSLAQEHQQGAHDQQEHPDCPICGEEFPHMSPYYQARIAADSVADSCPQCSGHTTELLNEDGESHCHSCGSIFKTKKKIPNDVAKDAATHVAENPVPQADMLHAPEQIDTLREEEVCPICGSVMDAEECEVCGYVEPPDGFDNPDLTKAKDSELREGDGDKPDEAFEDIPEGELGPVGQQPSNPPTLAHVTDDMAWDIALPSRSAATNPDRETPVLPGNKAATDEPNETVLEDPTTPVTSSVRTARDFIAAAGATRRTNMNHTADAASGAPAVATPDKNVDTTGVGGVLDASNEQASKADAQVDVLGVGGTGVESVGSDSTESLGEASPGSDDSGFEDSKNIESIPTKTFGDGSSGVERQADPVSSEVFEGNGKSSNWIIEATDDAPFPTDLPRIGEGQRAVKGTEPADPVGKAQDRVDVLQSVTSPSNNSGPTTTWTGTDGNGVYRQQDPVTSETLEGDAGVKAAHLFTAFKLADLEVELGLLQKDQKYARVAELEQQSVTDVYAKLEYAQKVKTAGLAKGGSKVASRLPVMGRDASTTVESSAPEDNTADEALFM